MRQLVNQVEVLKQERPHGTGTLPPRRVVDGGAIGGGAFKTEAQREEIAKNGNQGRQIEPREVDVKVSKVLETIANRHNTAVTSVALAYVMSKAPHVHPIVGGRKVEHLLGNIEALGLDLEDDDIKEIEGAYEFDHGFPTTFLFRGESKEVHPGNVTFKTNAAKFGKLSELSHTRIGEAGAAGQINVSNSIAGFDKLNDSGIGEVDAMTQVDIV